MKNMIIWVLTPCSSETAECFGGKYHLYPQDQRVNQARNQQKEEFSLRPASADFLLGLLFYSEYGCDMFFRKFELSPNYRALHSRRPHSQSCHCHEKSNGLCFMWRHKFSWPSEKSFSSDPSTHFD
jgi:hypothetical protein